MRAAVVFDRGADDAAGVGDEVRQYQNSILVQHALGFGRERNVGALRHEFGFQARDVVFADDIGASRGNPDLAFDVDDRIDSKLFSVRIVGDVLSRNLSLRSIADVDAFGIVNGSVGIAGGDQDCVPSSAEEARRMFAHRAEALDDDARAFEFKPQYFIGPLRRWL